MEVPIHNLHSHEKQRVKMPNWIVGVKTSININRPQKWTKPGILILSKDVVYDTDGLMDPSCFKGAILSGVHRCLVELMWSGSTWVFEVFSKAQLNVKTSKYSLKLEFLAENGLQLSRM